MKTRGFHLVTALWLAAAGIALAGCQRDGQPAVEAQHDNEGARIEVHGKEVEENLQQAGEELKAGAEQVREGAQEVGAALERGAERVGAEVGPIVQDVLDDAQITAQIKAKLVADPEVNAFHIDVDTVDGQVTLNGKVARADQKAEAERLARHTSGVRAVHNLIQVAGQANTPAPPQPGT